MELFLYVYKQPVPDQNHPVRRSFSGGFIRVYSLPTGCGTGRQKRRSQYRIENVSFKPYVKELKTPGGLNVLLDSPEDHVHHHGLMFALGINECDFWAEERGSVGPQAAGMPKACAPLLKNGIKRTEFAHTLTWKRPDGEALIEEKRLMRVFSGEGIDSTLVTWESVLTASGRNDAVKLWGNHYFGLGMRFVREMDGCTEFLHPERSEGKVYRGDERLTPGPWCACWSEVQGKPVTVALFEHPLNPRYPGTFFTMSVHFAYLSATLNLHEQPRTLRADDTLALRYGVALWDGHADASAIEQRHQEWLSMENRLRGRVNVALADRGTEAYASSEYGPDYSADRAIDGRYLVREKDKWNSAAHITPHYLRLDLEKPWAIDTVIIRHEGALPILGAFRNNSSDFRVQGSQKQWGPWTDLIKPVRGNTDNVTIHRFDPVQARHVRLLIETSEQSGNNAYGRIAEIEVYAPKNKETEK